MPRPAPLLLAAALLGGVLAVPAGAAPAAPVAFGPATVVDPVLGGSAPALVTDLSPAGRALDRSFVAWRPAGSLDGVALYRSNDGARSYVKRYGDAADPTQGGAACAVQQTPACLAGPGGGAALDVSRTGELLVAAGSTAVSRDGGSTVVLADTDLASAAGTAVGATALPGRVRLVARQVGGAVRVVRSDAAGAAGSWSVPPVPQLAGTGGGLVADRRGRVYVPLLAGGRAVVGVSSDGGRTFAVGGPRLRARAVPRLAVDTAGGLALVAVRPDGAVVLTRAGAGGARWSRPVRVDGTGRPADAPAASVVAGSPGRLAVAWYGRTGSVWGPRVATTTGGPFSQTAVARTPAASGASAPTALATPPALALDARGHLLVAWTGAAAALPQVLVARQARGASLLRGRPAALRPADGRGSDAVGDARFPLTGRAPGPRRPGLDLTGTSLSLRPDGVLEVRLGIADPARLTPPAGEQVKLVTRFELLGRSWYVAASLGLDGRPVYSAGQLGAGQVLHGGTGAQSHSYPSGTGVTGRVEAGRVVVHVPARLVGRPRPGSRLTSVTSAALVGGSDDAAVAGRLPVAVDATPPYDVVLGRPGQVDGLVTALRPARLLDTRRTGGALRPDRPRTLQVTGRGGVPGGAVTVLLQVTALSPQGDGEVRVGGAAPVPVPARRTSGSLVLAGLAPGGRLALSSTTTTGLLVDVVGVVRDGAGSALTTTPARRLLDTRSGAPLDGSGRRVAAPAGARAVLLGVTVTAARRSGVVVAWGGGGRPDAGGVVAEPRRVLTSTVLAQVAGDGTVGLATTAGAAHVTVDLLGVLGARGGRTYAVPPSTLADTRSGPRTRPGQVLLARTAGRLPATARQAVLQVTAYGATSAGYLTVWPGGPRPDVASLRLVPGRTTTGLVVVDLPENRAASVYVSAGTPHVRVDLVGATHP